MTSNPQHSKRSQKLRARITKQHNAGGVRSSVDDLFAGGAPVWAKMIGAAIATCLVVGVTFVEQGAPTDNPLVIAVGLGASALFGAFLGLALSMKDVVEKRLADGQDVGLVLRLFFAYRIWSLLFVWFPFVIFVCISSVISYHLLSGL